ncbi:KCNKN [Lepeophtheirus salmonis]|uniref:KCNKN n=1 Tax=Lepeophtheirus salmonis TaxID=72036 RepID=A0A7R8D265_LEPSM|nr:KCNKN [Lepeophtheirus salmonis]CAF3002762.1 KCNKN [Lepeophtheirus salmonis]
MLKHELRYELSGIFQHRTPTRLRGISQDHVERTLDPQPQKETYPQNIHMMLAVLFDLEIQAIELSAPEDPPLKKVEIHRLKTVQNLWNLTKYFNVLNQGRWNGEVDIVLKEYQNLMVNFIKSGYDQKTLEERWTFPAALMFTLSVITMIGYGNLVPKTHGSTQRCIDGMFVVNGDILKNLKRFKMKNSILMSLEQQVIVPSTTCLWVMMLYLLIGTVTFAEWEGWNYLDSVYFCVTSLAKIGFGDFIPGTSNTLFATESNSISHDEILRNEQIKTGH